MTGKIDFTNWYDIDVWERVALESLWDNWDNGEYYNNFCKSKYNKTFKSVNNVYNIIRDVYESQFSFLFVIAKIHFYAVYND